MIVKITTASNRQPLFISGQPSSTGTTSQEEKTKQAAAIVYALVNHLPTATIKLIASYFAEINEMTKLIDANEKIHIYQEDLRSLANNLIEDEKEKKKTDD